MPRQARREIIDPSQVEIVHCTQRCVRRAFLCGNDAVSGKSFEHRREWIKRRLEFLASIFGIECLTYSVMHNHTHMILRSRPDVVQSWSDEEVAVRWLRLGPKKRSDDASSGEISQPETDMIANNEQRTAVIRSRLSDMSWWMRYFSEHIARLANSEDEVTGHFWEGRYHAQPLLDESSLLACAVYVDLNPVRASLAETPETSKFTGAKDRIDDLVSDAAVPRDTHDWERDVERKHSGWMSPIQLNEAADHNGTTSKTVSPRRASERGFLYIGLTQYIQLLDWTGRQLHAKYDGVIPSCLAPILKRIGIDDRTWCRLINGFGRIFRRAAGTKESLSKEAVRRGQKWLRADGNPLRAVA